MAKPITHGKYTSYTNRKCRCPECTAAWREWVAEARQRRAERLQADPTVVEHGKSSTYLNWMCRCAPCTHAHTVERVARGFKKKATTR
jgi:hypothetical protein